MATDAKSRIVDELLSEFVEERVRQLPKQPFGLPDVMRALAAMLQEAGQAGVLARSDEERIAARLDQHPFLLRSKAAQWIPGLNTGSRTKTAARH